MFRIGEFSQIVRVSPRMLRHYEKCGLFYPAEIDKVMHTLKVSLLQMVISMKEHGYIQMEVDITPR